MFSLVCLSAVLAITSVQADDPLSTDDPAVQVIIIDLINTCRRNVNPTASNMVEVKWHVEAQKNAEKVAKQCTFHHSEQSERITSQYNCGENLYMTTGEGSWPEAIKAFCDEHKDFIFGKGPISPDKKTGHYTQVVWYNSRFAGCAVADCPNGRFRKFFVCHHCPPGNINNSPEPYGVGPPCADCPNNCNNGLCTNPCPWTDNAPVCKSWKPYCTTLNSVKTQCQGTCNCNNNEII